MEEDANVTSRARQCIKHFERCPEFLTEVWADEQLARFKIWASNLGVFARGHASIDYRLGPLGCNRPEFYNLILQFLEAIEANLKKGISLIVFTFLFGFVAN